MRSEVVKGGGSPELSAVEQNETGNGKEIGSEYASAIGGGRRGISERRIREERETEKIGEKVVRCGGKT